MTWETEKFSEFNKQSKKSIEFEGSIYRAFVNDYTHNTGLDIQIAVHTDKLEKPVLEILLDSSEFIAKANPDVKNETYTEILEELCGFVEQLEKHKADIKDYITIVAHPLEAEIIFREKIKGYKVTTRGNATTQNTRVVKIKQGHLIASVYDFKDKPPQGKQGSYMMPPKAQKAINEALVENDIKALL